MGGMGSEAQDLAEWMCVRPVFQCYTVGRSRGSTAGHSDLCALRSAWQACGGQALGTGTRSAPADLPRGRVPYRANLLLKTYTANRPRTTLPLHLHAPLIAPCRSPTSPISFPSSLPTRPPVAAPDQRQGGHRVPPRAHEAAVGGDALHPAQAPRVLSAGPGARERLLLRVPQPPRARSSRSGVRVAAASRPSSARRRQQDMGLQGKAAPMRRSGVCRLRHGQRAVASGRWVVRGSVCGLTLTARGLEWKVVGELTSIAAGRHTAQAALRSTVCSATSVPRCVSLKECGCGGGFLLGPGGTSTTCMTNCMPGLPQFIVAGSSPIACPPKDFGGCGSGPAAAG